VQVTSGKNLGKSVEAREEGNSLFTLGKFLPALQKYCAAVAFAPSHEVKKQVIAQTYFSLLELI
jgi:hypothetical protein